MGDGNGFDDIRGTLFYDYVRLIDEIKPKVFIYENVYGLKTNDNGRTWDKVMKSFVKLNYHFTPLFLDAKNFGIPQSRKRIFIVGFKNEEDFKRFKEPQMRERKFDLQNLLLENVKEGSFVNKNGNLEIIENIGGNVPSNLFLSQKLLDYVLSPGTGKFYHENQKTDLKVARALLSTMGNTHRASVNNYVTTNGKLRALHPREVLRLMGFPDDFKLVVSKSQAYKQIGNSIVVDVLIAILKEILDAME